MVRYQRDRRRVADQIRAEVDRAREAQREGDWITYLIRDPRKLDKRGKPAGTPIYVGQTKKFATRVRSRFDKCEKEATAIHSETCGAHRSVCLRSEQTRCGELSPAPSVANVKLGKISLIL